MSRLVCVPPELVEQVWPHVEQWFYQATAKCGDWTTSLIRSGLDKNKILLWAYCSEAGIHGAAATQILLLPKGRVCQVIACAGECDAWPDALATVEEFARAEGCVAMRLQGRKGWSRVFRDYDVEWVSLNKRLD